MAFDDVVLWLFTAMGITCMAAFCWTLMGLVCESRAHSFSGPEPAHSVVIARRDSAT